MKLTSNSAKNHEFATVLIGPEEVKSMVHKELLTSHSNFFRAALNGCFKEAEDRIVRLRDEDAGVFRFFVHWLYHKRFPNKHDAGDLYQMWAGESTNGADTMENLVFLYVFCEKYDAPELKIKTITCLYEHLDDPAMGCPLPDVETVKFVFDSLHESSPLCNLLADAHCHWANDDIWSDFDEGIWPPAFIGKVLRQYTAYAQGGRDRFSFLEPCDYHEHKTREEQSACQKQQEEEWERVLALS